VLAVASAHAAGRPWRRTCVGRVEVSGQSWAPPFLGGDVWGAELGPRRRRAACTATVEAARGTISCASRAVALARILAWSSAYRRCTSTLNCQELVDLLHTPAQVRPLNPRRGSAITWDNGTSPHILGAQRFVGVPRYENGRRLATECFREGVLRRQRHRTWIPITDNDRPGIRTTQHKGGRLMRAT
jgi:hypothetical protein